MKISYHIAAICYSHSNLAAVLHPPLEQVVDTRQPRDFNGYLGDHHQGKRSTSDHVNEAINYINHLQNKVKQLQYKRDELMKEVPNLHTTTGPENECSPTHLQPFVIVHPFPGGVEIVCSYSLKCVFPLSRVLDILLKEGLDVVSSTSTKIDERFIHTIISEVNMSI